MPSPHGKDSLFPINFTTGIFDGLTLPFLACMVASPYMASTPASLIPVGLCVSLIGAIAYGLARYFGEREEIKHNHPEMATGEAEQEIALMNAIGIDKKLTLDMQAKMEEERALWLSEVKEYGMGWEQYDAARARESGLHTAAGFFAGGLAVTTGFYFVTPDWSSLVFPCYVYFGLYLFSAWLKGYCISTKPMRYALMKGPKSLITLVLALVVTFFISSGKQQNTSAGERAKVGNTR